MDLYLFGQLKYSRPTNWRAGMRDAVWGNAKDRYGRVRDPVTVQEPEEGING